MSEANRYLLGTATLFAVSFLLLTAIGDDVDFPKTIPAKLEWTVSTNWNLYVPPYTMRTLLGWYGGEDPNTSTTTETGIVQSNLVATVLWKDRPYSVIVDSVFVKTLSRSFTLKTERVYQD